MPAVKPGVLSPLKTRPDLVVDAAFVQTTAKTAGFALVDGRAHAAYDGVPPPAGRGGGNPLGHIPGAVSVSFEDMFNLNGELKPQAELESYFTKAGVKPGDTVVGYCWIINKAWYPGFKRTAGPARWAFLLMCWLFIFCAISGYGTSALLAFYPKTGYVLKTIALALDILTWITFIAYVRIARVNFIAFGDEQALGHKIFAEKDAISQMDDEAFLQTMAVVLEESGIRRDRNLIDIKAAL